MNATTEPIAVIVVAQAVGNVASIDGCISRIQLLVMYRHSRRPEQTAFPIGDHKKRVARLAEERGRRKMKYINNGDGSFTAISSIPKKINICGISYDIRECEDNFTSSVVSFGEIDFKHGEIRLVSDQPDDLKMQTLIHEWLHGALFMIGQDDIKNNEVLVQGLAMAIFQTFSIKEEKPNQ